MVNNSGNELARATVQGDTETNENPQIQFGVSTEVVQVPIEMDEGDEGHQKGRGGAESNQREEEPEAIDQGKGDQQAEGSEADTVMIEALENVISSGMCREMYRLWCSHEIDDEMVLKKYGKQVLETFEINRWSKWMSAVRWIRSWWNPWPVAL